MTNWPRLIPFTLGLLVVGGFAYATLDIPETLSGPAQVIDGDTLRIRGQRIRIFGIDAPELSQPCGRQAADKMRELVEGQNVSCAIKDRDHYSRLVAQCSTPLGDLGQTMVASGLAEDYTRYSGGYYANVKPQTGAKCNFSSPQKWRADHKNH